jgi:hypothetical protein
MTISYLLAPIPKWVLINNEGTVAGGAKLYTYRSLNKIQEKIVYQDAGGTLAWTNPIIFDLNGAQGPFYWSVNSADLSDTYYLEAYDSDDNLLWTLDNYGPPGSGGGGGNVTTYIPLTNYIANNQFIDHIADTANPTAVTDLVIAPSNHKGFTPSLINPIVGTSGVLGSDIRFVKNNTNATDQITFPLFALASAPLTGDVTPVDYVRYQCTNSPAGESYKAFQFPITQKVKNLANKAMTFMLWSKVTATPVTLDVYVRQYFGSGTAASAEVRTLVGSIVLTTTWTQYNISLTIPDVAGKSLGTPGLQTDDDALYIQLEMPLGQPCDVQFIKPKLYLGTINPSLDFDNYDQINSINSTPRTGDMKTSYLTTPPNGWLVMDDKTIGNVASGATSRANADTFFLYKTLWDGVVDAWAPVSGGRGASALADFLALKTITLPRQIGRVLGGIGSGAGLTTRVMGESIGEENHLLDASEMPDTVPTSTSFGNASVNAGTFTNVPAGGGTWTPGGNTYHNIMQPTTFMNVFIKL